MPRKYIPLNVTPEQRANLETLWRVSPSTEERLPFDMSKFMTDSAGVDSAEIRDPECGSTACMVGRGPACGVLPTGELDWNRYAHRAFGVGIYSRAWDWIFDIRWMHQDNTLEGARARLRVALDRGIPSMFAVSLYRGPDGKILPEWVDSPAV